MKKLKKLFKKKIFGVFTGVYVISTIVSVLVFTVLSGASIGGFNLGKLTDMRSKIETEPKTEICPINGAYFTKTEKNIWSNRRPMGVMIENHIDARPLSGLSRADVVYEAVAEGGTTRFLGIYYCGASAQSVNMAPIRSARVYFIDWVSEYGDKPLYVHWGGANNYCNYGLDQENCQEDSTKQPGKIDPRVMAIEKLTKLGWYREGGNSLDGGRFAGSPYTVRNCNRLSDEVTDWEHCPVGFSDLLFDLGDKNGFGGRGWDKNFTEWKFIDGNPSSDIGVTEISFEFWPNKPDFDVVWEYNQEDNNYLRSNGGEPQLDWEFEKPQISATNVVIMFVDEETSFDEEGHVYYETLGEGEAIIFQNGTAIKGTWEKAKRASRTIFKDETGEEIKFVRGAIWIEAVPTGNEILFN